MTHHPVFEKFECYAGAAEQGYEVDFVGSRTRRGFRGVTGGQGPQAAVQTSYPPLDEEYFEWIDVLEAVVSARQRFTMVELGAGYGRWSVRAACAARRYSNISLFLVAAEAEPCHFEWMKTHFHDNHLDPEQHRLVRCAVSNSSGEAFFYVGMPDGGNDSPQQWYGQALTKDYETTDQQFFDEGRQEQVVQHKSGWKSIRVPCRTLPELVSDLTLIDLIDLDVQGEELKIIRASIDLLNSHVRRLHIGTHSQEIEAGLRELLNGQQWLCKADYACCRENITSMGPVSFLDGVQSWVNPRLV